MKRFSSGLLSTLLLSSAIAGGASANAANDISVVLDGVPRTFEQKPVQSNNVTLVPMRALFQSMGARVDYDQATGLITAAKGNDTIELRVNQTVAYKNGQKMTLQVPAKLIQGSVYVPLRFVGEAFGAQVSWEPATLTVRVDSAAKAEESGHTDPLAPAPDASKELPLETNTEPLSYEDAVALAISHSNDIKSQEKALKIQDNNLEDAADNIDYIPASNQGGNPDANSAWNNYSQSQIKYLVSKKQLEVTKEGLAYQVRSGLNSIINAIEAKRLADLSLQDAEWKLRIAQTKLSNQMASEYEVTQAQNAVEQSKAARDVADKNLSESYRDLNALIGYKPDQKYEIVDVPEFKEFEDDVDAHVGRIQKDSPTVWMAERGVQQAELNLDYFTFVGQTVNSYDNVKIDVQLKKLSVADAKKQLEDAVRQTYDQIKKLETQYSQLQASIGSANEALNVVQKRYELGMATEYEVFEAQLQLETLNQQIITIVTGLDNAKLAYSKPWLVAAR
ncbi:stalk domain-containing protein [Paenibacillus sanguinis]|uniref:stalk domain-containing protein n=1 Tax=Paenibacillus sanguinis TaxID=225906 RepID=UPI0003691D20|nr:stalk domain-containing protein [Paenibacillus sanguinis]